VNSRFVFVALLFFARTLIGFGANPESIEPDPDAILNELYKAHDAEKGPFFHETRAALEKYFTKELARLYQKDTATAKGEVGALEFDALYESQDPQITNFKIGEVRWGGMVKHEGDASNEGLAAVEVTFKDSGEARRLGFRFAQNAQKAWKISDIDYSDGSSLLGILRGDGAGSNSGKAKGAKPNRRS
jgi:hypothetical protein